VNCWAHDERYVSRRGSRLTFLSEVIPASRIGDIARAALVLNGIWK
jgi:hypothetical protein